MLREYSFKPKLWALALALCASVAGIALGNWQAGRAQQKREAGANIERVALRGTFDARHTVFLDNKLHRGRAGYHVIQPLRLSAAGDGMPEHVLVDRGWVEASLRREVLPVVRTPVGEVQLEGVRRTRFPRAYEAGTAPPAGKVWQNVSVEAFGAWSKLRLLPWVLEQHSVLDDGLVREWPRPETGIEKHESYSLQWYGLAVLALVLFVVLSFRRNGPASS
jgi:surfeit locus 1 family protein